MSGRARSLRRIAIVLAAVWVGLELLSWLALVGLAELAGESYRPLTRDRLPPEIEVEVDKVLAGRLDYLRHDPELGWSIRPNGKSGPYAANGEGLRAAVDYSLSPAAGTLRIATFGDSFTHGDDVEYEDTWQARLQGALASTEVLNFGVPAYGPGQAWLRYRSQGRGFGAHIVLVGYMAENIYRSVNVFRPFYSPSYTFPLTKPRFALRDGALTLLPNPLPSLADYGRLKRDPRATLEAIGEHDAFFGERYDGSWADVLPSFRLAALAGYRVGRRARAAAYDPESEAFRVTAAILQGFCADVAKAGAIPLVVVFPDRIRAAGGAGAATYRPLVDRLESRGAAVLDLQNAFDRYAGDRDLSEFSIGRWGHYSPAGHAIVARYLDDVLRREGLTDVAGVESYRRR